MRVRLRHRTELLPFVVQILRIRASRIKDFIKRRSGDVFECENVGQTAVETV